MDLCTGATSRSNSTLNAAKPRALLEGPGSDVRLNLAADTIKLTFAGTLAVAGAPKGKGDVDLSIPSIRNLVAWSTGQPLTMPGDGLGPFSIKGKVSIDGAKYALAGVQLGLDQMKGTADFTVDTGGARPSIKGKLAVDKLDLNHYMAPAGKSRRPLRPIMRRAMRAAPNRTPPLPRLKGGATSRSIPRASSRRTFSLALAADAILWRKVEVGKTAVQITLDAGKLSSTSRTWRSIRAT